MKNLQLAARIIEMLLFSNEFNVSLRLNLCPENLSHSMMMKTRFSGQNMFFLSNRKKFFSFTGPECNKLFQQLESGSLTKVLWKQLKPFVRGKILFSPNVIPIEKVLDRVSLCGIWNRLGFSIYLRESSH